MSDRRLPHPWDEMINLLQQINFDHLDALESDPAATIAALAKREPDKAAWLLCEAMRAQSRLPELQRQLSANPKVVARAAEIARIEAAQVAPRSGLRPTGD